MSEGAVYAVSSSGTFHGIQRGGETYLVSPENVSVRLNPYAGVDWSGVDHLPGVSHAHSTNQSQLDSFYAAGVRVMACSQYYPEQPVPASSYASNPGMLLFLKNSEQHSCTDSSLHFCPVGSAYSNDGGTGVPWREAFSAAFDLLDYEDGGGITLNHPSWSTSITNSTWTDMLDHDPRVLGIEVYNHTTVNNAAYAPPRNDTDFARWDDLLATGRRCWGFWAHDHYLVECEPYRGFNMLLMSEVSEHEALKAYRDGRFYGSMTQQLQLTGVSVVKRDVTISTDGAASLHMVTNLGVETKTGPSATFAVPIEAVYARFEGESADDTIYTQPILF